MARTLTATISDKAAAILTSATAKTVSTLGDTSTNNYAFASGTGANQVSQVWESTGRSLSNNSSETLVFVGSLTNDQNETINFTAIKALRILNKSATQLEVGKAASHAWEGWCSSGSSAYVPPQSGTTPGLLEIVAPAADGLAVGSGATDQLKIANNSNTSATYDIFVMGNS
jgi:hypothetical protein